MDWLILLATSMICAAGAVYWMSRRPEIQPIPIDLGMPNKVYLFADTDLVDASIGAPELPEGDAETTDWQRLYEMVVGRFPDFPDSIEQIKQRGRTIHPAISKDDTGTILSEWLDGVTRIELLEQPEPQQPQLISSPELSTLQTALDEAPNPIWRVDDNGTVRWYNKAYETIYRKLNQSDPTLTSPLFNPEDKPAESGQTQRLAIPIPNSERVYWFDVSTTQQDGYCLYYASDINAVVDAETAQRNFVQTLAKTFAQLSIGLAIFDRNRQLVLFNPALIDLTSLKADFLSGRPNLFSFFDRLRDSRVLPEPKNYNSWRHQMANMVAAAADGQYQETWSLPSGSVYSVNGRPHPDGAVAFLFEDITAEVTLTRRFRSELELGQSILDNLTDAIAVFGRDGVLTLCNHAYCELWNVNPEGSFASVTIVDASRDWQNQSEATPVWGDVRDFVAGRENRVNWWAQVRLKSSETLVCTVSPVKNGATMVNFSRLNAPTKTEPKRRLLIETA